MTLHRLQGALRSLILNSTVWSAYDDISYSDDSIPDLHYVLLARDSVRVQLNQYLDSRLKISSMFLMSAVIATPDIQALFTIDNKNNIVMHFVGHSKLHLPGITISSAIKYDITDIEMSCKQLITKQQLPAGVVTTADIDEPVKRLDLTDVISLCDCGAHKCGYKDTELHGHSRWCRVNDTYGA